MAFKNPISSMPTYELYMMNDINTKGCTQWYYFSATSKSRGKAKIRLMNFVLLKLYSISLPLYIRKEWRFSYLMMVWIGKGREHRYYMVGQVLRSHNILWILFMISKSLGSKYSLLMDFRILTLFILLVISIPYLMNSSSKSKLIAM